MRSRSGAELPQLELECLAALWALEEAPVARVHQRLAERGRPLAYTTVLTVMERLLRKGAVARVKRGRAFIYTPRVSRDAMRERALARLVDNYFASRQELRQYLDGDGVLPPAPPAPVADADEPAALLD
jgi:predicted transcriptional regulator